MKKKLTSYVINLIGLIILFVILSVLISTGIFNQYYTGIIMLMCIYIVAAVSLNIATGFLGQMALGHAGFMAIGAYSGALLSIALKTSGLPNFLILILACLLGGAVAGVFGILIGIPALRLRGDYLGIITLGFGEIIRVVLVNLDFTGGAQGLVGIPRILDFNSAFWIMAVIVAMMFTLIRSRHGRAIMSIRENEIAAEAVGIPTTRYKVFGFAVAAFFGGVSGAMFAHYLGFLAPAKFGFMLSVEIMVMVVLGGMGSITGSIVAAGVLTALPEVLRAFADYRLLVYSAILVIMMIFRPQGIFGRHEFSLTGLMDSLKNRRKKKVDGGEA
jgi:branched-chain amino acid transport system permease protein